MLTDSEKMPPYERQLLWIFGQAVKNSHELTVFQKEFLENAGVRELKRHLF